MGDLSDSTRQCPRRRQARLPLYPVAGIRANSDSSYFCQALYLEVSFRRHCHCPWPCNWSSQEHLLAETDNRGVSDLAGQHANVRLASWAPCT